MKYEGDLVALRSRLGGTPPALKETTAQQLRDRLASILVVATKQEVMRTPVRLVAEHLVVAEAPEKITKKCPTAKAVVAGSKDRTRPILFRVDDAWLHFSISVNENPPDRLELIAYDFEVCFPDPHDPTFVRLDLNPSGDKNGDRGLLSHLHPDHRDIQLSYPSMSPREALLMCIYDLRVRCRD